MHEKSAFRVFTLWTRIQVGEVDMYRSRALALCGCTPGLSPGTQAEKCIPAKDSCWKIWEDCFLCSLTMRSTLLQLEPMILEFMWQLPHAAWKDQLKTACRGFSGSVWDCSRWIECSSHSANVFTQWIDVLAGFMLSQVLYNFGQWNRAPGREQYITVIIEDVSSLWPDKAET